MVRIIEGNLMNAKEDIIAHQVNSVGAMGSGVAAQIKSLFPEAFFEYKKLCNSTSISSELLGRCQIVYSNGKFVANIFGQNEFGQGKQYTNIDALRTGLSQLKEIAMDCNYTIALPYKIGSDRGGAKWEEVYKIIDDVFSDYEVTLYRLKL